ncbi:MAG: tRNA lysidine(34) synthetase TilS [Rhodospirillaceae bacterium]|nr:tRNA lysidine(34) synthetase TilS [Rhodospirillaceae bacterium]
MADLGVTFGARIAVAVSGGPDSMALLRLAHEWATANGRRMVALTVDHRLRAESAAEAAGVGAWCASLGIEHHILTWDGGAQVRQFHRSAQDAARDARYGLLAAWCRANDVRELLLAHHAEDQIETFLMRLARGSGVRGLAAMNSVTRRAGITLARPLLAAAKSDLVATCARFGQDWALDPSNQDPKYARVRMRRARELLGQEGLSDERLLATIGHLQRAWRMIAAEVAAAQVSVCTWNELGVVTLSAPRLFVLPEEVALRLLAGVLMRAGGQTHGPRFEALRRLFAKLRAPRLAPTTLHGCAISRSGDAVTVAREARHLPEAMDLAPGGTVTWDNRFDITRADSAGEKSWRLRAYRNTDRAILNTWAAAHELADMPARQRSTLPVLDDDRGLLAVPHMGLWRPDAQSCAASLTVRFVADRDGEDEEL